jgi:hypothetical protein
MITSEVRILRSTQMRAHYSRRFDLWKGSSSITSPPVAAVDRAKCAVAPLTPETIEILVDMTREQIRGPGGPDEVGRGPPAGSFAGAPTRFSQY